MPNATDYKLMIALAEERHFGKAAERCHMSGPAVTRAVKRWEDQLGCALFERDNRSVRLTEQGDLYLEYCRKSMAEWEALQSNLQIRQNQLQGVLSLYCSVTAVYSLLKPLVSACRAKYPGIELRLHTGDHADAVQRVLEHREQVAIAACPAVLPDTLEFQPLMVSPYVLIQPAEPDGILAGLLNAEQVDWSTLPVILAERGVGRERIEAMYRHLAAKPHIYATVSGHEAIVSMVALGFGIGGVPDIVVRSSPQQNQIRIIDSPVNHAPVEIGLICHKRHKQNAIVDAFWELSRECELAPLTR